MSNKINNEFSSKSICFDDECLDALQRGAEKVYKAVSATMGAAGRTVILGDNVTQVFPKVTKDGVTVAKEIELGDKYEKVGADLLRQAAFAQLYAAGDGTTLTTVLGYELFKNGLKAVKSGANRSSLMTGIEEALSVTTDYIKDRSKVADKKTILDIATISANGDAKIAGLIADAIDKTGPHGMIFYDKGRKDDHYVDFSEGYQLNRGVEYSEFNTGPNVTQLFNPYVLVTDFCFQWGHDISSALQLLPFSVVSTDNPNNLPVRNSEKIYDRPLVIFCPEIKDEALNVLAATCQQFLKDKRVPFAIWICPDGGLGTIKQKQVLADIAALSGATYIKEEMGTPPNRWKKEYLGQVEYLDSVKIKTTIKSATKATKRIDELKDKIEKTDIEGERKIYEDSLARLNGGIAIIRIAGSNESEQKEIMDRVDDAIKATKCAMEQGFVNGGGVELVRASKIKSGKKDFGSDEALGFKIFQQALLSPLKTILENASFKSELIIEKILNDECAGYDLFTGKPVKEEMAEKSIIDPTKVIICALKNSASVAKLMLRSSVMIVNDKGV